jgi:hypothetical protein
LANHKTALAVKTLIREFYGQAPKYSYFNGCSDGGRQGLQEAQRFPDDFDGVLAGSATIDVVATNTFFHAWNVRVNSRPDGRPILTASKISALAQAVLKACAGLNGLIADPRSCSFDVATVTCLECKDDASCLTVEQADVARKIWMGVTDETGTHLFPGGLPFGSELSWIGSMVPLEETATNTLSTAGDYQWSWDFPSFMCKSQDLTCQTVSHQVAFCTREPSSESTILAWLLSAWARWAVKPHSRFAVRRRRRA